MDNPIYQLLPKSMHEAISPYSLTQLCDPSLVDQLPISKANRNKLHAVREVIRQYNTKPSPIKGADDAMRIAQDMIGHQTREHLLCIALNAKHDILGTQVVHIGTVSATFVSTRDILKFVLEKNAYGFIVAHNHPSGDVTPSQKDIETTKKLIQTSELMGVQCLDHIIVSSTNAYSIREHYSHLGW